MFHVWNVQISVATYWPGALIRLFEFEMFSSKAKLWTGHILRGMIRHNIQAWTFDSRLLNAFANNFMATQSL